VDYFEPTEAWTEVLHPRNQVLYGGFGSGKSMLLKRLQAAAMARQPAFDSKPFVGVYINLILEFSFVDALMKLARGSVVQRRWPDAPDRAASIAENFLSMTVGQAVLWELNEARSREVFGELTRESEIVREYTKLYDLSLPANAKLLDVMDALRRAREELRAESSSAKVFNTRAADTEQTVALSSVADAVSSLVALPRFFQHFPEGLPLFLLFDQLEGMSAEVHTMLLPLLRRGNRYTTKCATRLYGFVPGKVSENPLVAYDDYFPVHVGHTSDSSNDFARLAVSVADRMVRSVTPSLSTSQLFGDRSMPADGRAAQGYAGLKDLLWLSSGSIRMFLELCSHAVMCAASGSRSWWIDGVPVHCQEQAARVWAKRERDKLSSSNEVTGPQVVTFIDNLLREARKTQEGLPQQYSIEDDLWGPDSMSPRVKEMLRAAFQFDAVRFVSQSDASLFDLPSRFAASSYCAPLFALRGRSVATPHFIRDLASYLGSPRSVTGSAEVTEQKLRLFLSTSFRVAPAPTEGRKRLRAILESKFSVVVGDELPSSRKLLQRMRDSIASVDVVVVEVSEPTPSVMLELGMSYALKKRVFVTFDASRDDVSLDELQSYLRTLDIVSYSLRDDHLRDARDKIWQRSSTPPQDGELMESNIYGQSLRPKQLAEHVFFYVPKGASVLRTALSEVEATLNRRGQKLVLTSAAPASSSLLEEIMYCISLLPRDGQTRCWVDTSGHKQPDLAGAFALGVAVGLRKDAIRIEQSDRSMNQRLALWPEPYETWSTTEELLRLLEGQAFTPERSRAARRRK
jgi:hypothetical protein